MLGKTPVLVKDQFCIATDACYFKRHDIKTHDLFSLVSLNVTIPRVISLAGLGEDRML